MVVEISAEQTSTVSQCDLWTSIHYSRCTMNSSACCTISIESLFLYGISNESNSIISLLICKANGYLSSYVRIKFRICKSV